MDEDCKDKDHMLQHDQLPELDEGYVQLLLSLPTVVGVGIGYKEIDGLQTDQLAVVVLVKQKLPPCCLDERSRIPALLNGMVTDVVQVGKIEVIEAQPVEQLDSTSLPCPDKYELNEMEIQQSRTSRVRPAPAGVSIGHYKITAGTFGTVVYDRASGQPLILSNNHVLANATNGSDGRAAIGDPVLQPGPYDGGTTAKDSIAKLDRYVALKELPNYNTVDCAAAKPLQNNLIVPTILGIGTVRGTTAPYLNMVVKKSGRTTAVTQGQIRALNVTSYVDYGSGRTLLFRNQILTTRISSPGDSGSLVLDRSNRAVGLLFAGSNTTTLVNPIAQVLAELKAKF